MNSLAMNNMDDTFERACQEADRKAAVQPARRLLAASPFTGDPFTEDALALRFSDKHKDDLRYIALKGQWLKWDSDRWLPEVTLLAFNLARQSCRADAKEYGNGKPPAGVSSAKTVAAVERLAKLTVGKQQR